MSLAQRQAAWFLYTVLSRPFLVALSLTCKGGGAWTEPLSPFRRPTHYSLSSLHVCAIGHRFCSELYQCRYYTFENSLILILSDYALYQNRNVSNFDCISPPLKIHSNRETCKSLSLLYFFLKVTKCVVRAITARMTLFLSRRGAVKVNVGEKKKAENC